ncbi:transporter [Roseiterribacter gracilis]|uniref:Transporter n=1 Tax=Roseiterribacter gracilis TaxID=2812848 RepID=A0A8S8X8K0_9PROT|nr:hypothetical protein TMPK1_00560 [Rhodospirillales bacterium TMPK1]
MRVVAVGFACVLLASSAFAADDGLRDFSTDRPNKSSSATTVDAGHWQVESDLFNWSRSSDPDFVQRTMSTVLPTLKLGVTNNTDIELTLPTRVWVRNTFRSGRTSFSWSTRGWSDITLTGKLNLLGNDEGDVAIGIAPYVKLPTGSTGISNKQTEFGVYAPVTWKLDEDWSLSVQLQLDALASDNNPDKKRFNAQTFVQLSYAMTDSIVLSVEHYAAHKFNDGTGSAIQTFDLAAAWLVQPDLQFDISAYLPLNKAAPDLVVILGVSKRF